uniref:Uncharacterized protein n=1 Tax=Hemiselmis tepida TaxID=464990 RepID=A0A7S0V5R0_9CRYP|mmetsp:Transcript_11408/g.29657  ORF Transcript_11408/g.29657 Transcript_11408/m.29657 type:complete len:168 (+) Transcript_11408:3-506(+)
MSGEDGKGEDMQDTLKAMGGPETPVLTEEELAFIEVQNKLFVAAEDGDVEGIKSALEAGADVNVQQEDEALSRTMLTTINEGLLGPSALHLAAMFGHVSAVEEILESDAKIDCVTAEGNTPLHLAIISKQQDVVNVLVSKGADVERPNEVGAPATELAEMMGIEIEQ